MNFSIISAHISEKSLSDAQRGIYTFDVEKNSTKREIAKELEYIYGVHVTKVTTTKISGKIRSSGRKRVKVKRPDRKKARVQLKSGETIKAFDVGSGK